MIIFSMERFKVGEILNGSIALDRKKIYKGPVQVMREATEEEFIEFTTKERGKPPRKVNNNKCYYYEVSID